MNSDLLETRKYTGTRGRKDKFRRFTKSCIDRRIQSLNDPQAILADKSTSSSRVKKHQRMLGEHATLGRAKFGLHTVVKEIAVLAQHPPKFLHFEDPRNKRTMHGSNICLRECMHFGLSLGNMLNLYIHG